MQKKFNILGTDYTVKFLNKEQDKTFMKNECDGYTDPSSHVIAILEKPDDCNLENYEFYLQNNIRHELIHAFLFESGLGFNWQHTKEFGHDETTIDWFARQNPKIEKVFNQIIAWRTKVK